MTDPATGGGQEDREPEEAYAAALSGLPGIGPAALVGLLESRTPMQAWKAILRGEIERAPSRRARTGEGQLSLAASSAPSSTWRGCAAGMDPERWWWPISRRGVRATWPGRPTYPAALATDPSPPGVLFWRGQLQWLDRPCVAIVGTRAATPDGRTIAYQLGRDLVRAGICVVSGLALGIDGAAHAGALSAARPAAEGLSEGFASGGDRGSFGATVGVAASGVDVPYPRRHAGLWEEVVRAGAVISETPPGRPAQAWRFPSRNRIIAGLVRMVVVVESHYRGGSLITAEAALERGVDVRVVPGPVHSSASAGSNQLLYDGPGPVRNARDVLDGLGILLSDPGSRPPDATGDRRPSVATASLSREVRDVFEALGRRPSSLNQVVEHSGQPISAVVRALDHLVAAGLARDDRGWWVRAG